MVSIFTITKSVIHAEVLITANSTLAIDNQVPKMLNHNYPLFLSTVYNSSTILISLQLTGAENYTIWSHAMCIAILGRNKLRFIDGTYKRANFDPVSLNFGIDVIKTWIMNSVSKELLSRIVYSCDASAV